MIRFLEKNDTLLILITPLALLVGLLLKGLVWSPFEFWGTEASISLPWPTWLSVILSFILSGLTAFLFNRVVQNSVLLGRISSLPMLVFVILAIAIPSEVFSPEFWLLGMLQVALLKVVLDLPDGIKTGPNGFNAGILIGIAIFFEPWVFLLSWLVFQAQLSTGLLNFKRLVIHLMGVVLPIYLLNASLFLLDEPLIFPFPEFSWEMAMFALDTSIVMQWLLVAYLVLMTIISLTQVGSSSTLRERRKWYLIVTYLVVSGLITSQVGFNKGLYFLMLPASVIVSRVLLNTSNSRLKNMGFVVLVVLMILLNIW